MRFRNSSDRISGVRRPAGDAPFARLVGENAEPGTADAVGVAVPELGLEEDSEAVDANKLDSEGFERR
jgi:hypothetical protein